MSEKSKNILRKALQREHAPKPDVDEAWQDLSARLHLSSPVAEEEKHTTHKLKWISYALKGIAATAAILLVVRLFFPSIQLSTSRHSSTVLSPIAQRVETRTAHHNVASSKTQLSKDSTNITASSPIINLKTARAEIRHAQLPDGSSVWLNAESKLAYTQLSNGTRRVTLQGEGYFEVKHDAQHPFIIETGGITVRDLGTAFNIQSYSGRPVSVSVISGSVSVLANSKGYTLRHSQQLTIKNTGCELSTVDTYPLTQWKEGLFYFHETALKDVIREIARWYGVNVVIEQTANVNMQVHFVGSRKATLTKTLQDLDDIDGVQMELRDGAITVK